MTEMRKRDGSSPANAIIEDQRVWRKRNCPGFTVTLQIVLSINGRDLDQVFLRSPSGDETRIVFFDVSKNYARALDMLDRDGSPARHPRRARPTR